MFDFDHISNWNISWFWSVENKKYDRLIMDQYFVDFDLSADQSYWLIMFDWKWGSKLNNSVTIIFEAESVFFTVKKENGKNILKRLSILHTHPCYFFEENMYVITSLRFDTRMLHMHRVGVQYFIILKINIANFSQFETLKFKFKFAWTFRKNLLQFCMRIKYMKHRLKL